MYRIFFKNQMVSNSVKIICVYILAIGLVPNFLISDAFAYIDPGSGSLIIQMLIGALVGVGITIRVYWYKIKEKISRTRNR